MLGGVEDSDTAQAHAEELLALGREEAAGRRLVDQGVARDVGGSGP
jgi:hypothetical protein